MFASKLFQHPVTAVSWSFDGRMFLAGSFNTLCLGDKLGWIHSLHKLQTSTVSSINWASNDTQVAVGFNGETPICATVVQR
ncbi:unnamed protein product [Soboliphyme baturini]|uniref:ANAPC4_WD40 domain-containing protein n=1 Tax=Soboliphyme baturini TaxID=241478 RepID=A0A183J3E4_9BILA|nr:unnamed protein product [Soboliphyme baturini]